MIVKKHILFFVLLCVNSPLLHASILDSLSNVVKKQLAHERIVDAIATYRELAIEEFVLGDLDASLQSFEAALDLSLQIGDKKLEGMSLYSKGFIFSRQNRYEEALQFFAQSMAIGRELITDEYWHKNLYEISMIYLTLGDYDIAYQYKLQLLNDYEIAQDTSKMTEVWYDIGSIFSYQGNYNLALRHYEAALQLAEVLEDSVFIYQSLGAIGSVYGNLKQYDLSLDYNQCALEWAEALQYDGGIAYAIFNTGYDYLNLKQNEKALNNLTKALKLMRQQGNQFGEVSSLLGVGEVSSAMEQHEKAILFGEKALELLEEIGNQSQLRDAYQTLANIYFKANKSTKAFEYQRQYIALKDSLFNQEVLQQMSGLQMRYEIQKKERENEIAILRKDAKISRLYQYGMIGGGVLLLLVLTMLSLFLRSLYHQNQFQRKTNTLLAQKNEEIQIQVKKLAESNRDLERFAYIASHDLKEPLRNIGSYVSLIKRRFQQNEESKPYFDFVTEGVGRMYRLLDDLLAYSKIDRQDTPHQRLSLNDLLERIQQRLSPEIETSKAKITIVNLPSIKANEQEIYQLFANLLSNALKFRGNKAPLIGVDCQETETYYLFSVKDNGIGIAQIYHEQIFSVFQRLHSRVIYKGNGIGLSICKKIVERYKGEIWVESTEGEGSTFHFSLLKNIVGIKDELVGTISNT